MTRLLATIFATLALTVLAAQPALADVTPTLTVSVQPQAKAEHGYVLNAHIQTSDGKGIAEATLLFYELVDFVGAREMYLGSATTDGRGNASLAYLPARTGPHQILVRFAGQAAVGGGSLTAQPSERLASADGQLSFDADVAAPQPRVERSPLAAFSDRVPYGVAVVVLVVWGLVAFALIATARSIFTSRNSAGKEETA